MNHDEKVQQNFDRILHARKVEYDSVTKERDALQKAYDSLSIDFTVLKKQYADLAAQSEEINRQLETRNELLNKLQNKAA